MTSLLKRLTLQHPETLAIQGSIIATWILAFIAVTLRFVARRLSKAGLWYDDFMIIPALVFLLSRPDPLGPNTPPVLRSRTAVQWNRMA